MGKTEVALSKQCFSESLSHQRWRWLVGVLFPLWRVLSLRWKWVNWVVLTNNSQYLWIWKQKQISSWIFLMLFPVILFLYLFSFLPPPPFPSLAGKIMACTSSAVHLRGLVAHPQDNKEAGLSQCSTAQCSSSPSLLFSLSVCLDWHCHGTLCYQFEPCLLSRPPHSSLLLPSAENTAVNRFLQCTLYFQLK